jgi:glycosyl transferase family 87
LFGYLRSRTRLWAAAGIWGGLLLVAIDLYSAAVTYVPGYAVRNDFRLMYGAALVGLRQGYAHVYDLAAQQAAVQGLGPGFYWSPYLNPPPLAWLATPFTLLPFPAALVAWSALLIGAALLAWHLVAPGSPLVRLAYLALWLGVFPVAYGLLVGQPVVLVAASVAVAWWLMERNRNVAAGLMLSLIVLKPQVALLVPACLLVAGRYRVFGTWLGASLLIGLASLAMLGTDGLARYRDVLTLASHWDITRRYAVAGPLGLGPQVYAVEALVAMAALAAAWRHRHGPPAIPIAAGIVASLLFTPYVGFQDFTMLVVAGWLVVRARPSAIQVGLLVVGYCLLEFALVVLAVPILLAEACLLLSFLFMKPVEPSAAKPASGEVQSRRWDSNPRPATYEAAALPAELRRRESS